MKTFFLLVVTAALAATWAIERFSTAQLTAAIDAQGDQERALISLQRERDRLRALQPTAGELESLRRAAAEHARLQNEIDTQAVTRAAQPRVLPLGEWTPAGAWKNRGQSTPHAAVETALWAAAGGDLSTLKRLLAVNGDARQAADSLLATLPAETRALYPTPEDLISAFTIKNIPEELYQKLKESAEANHRSMSDEAIFLIRVGLVMSRPVDVAANLERARQIRELTAHYVITDEELTKFKNEGRDDMADYPIWSHHGVFDAAATLLDELTKFKNEGRAS